MSAESVAAALSVAVDASAAKAAMTYLRVTVPDSYANSSLAIVFLHLDLLSKRPGTKSRTGPFRSVNFGIDPNEFKWLVGQVLFGVC